MASAGDTRLGLIANGHATPTPADGATAVAIDLANITYQLRIEEYLTNPFPGWFVGAFVDIVSVANMVLSISPAHSTDTLTFEIGPGGTNDYVGLITIPSLADFSGLTEYTWSVNLDITHGTQTSGEVERNYTTEEVSFTTEQAAPAKPTSPSPSDTATGITLDHSQVSWTAGAGTTTFNVYFGESGSEVLVALGQDVSDENWAIPFGTLDYSTTYGWRVDAVNAIGTTTGDTWTFTTIALDPPVSTGKNNMATIRKLVAAADNKIWHEDI